MENFNNFEDVFDDPNEDLDFINNSFDNLDNEKDLDSDEEYIDDDDDPDSIVMGDPLDDYTDF